MRFLSLQKSSCLPPFRESFRHISWQTLEFWARLLRRQALGLLLSGVNILETIQLSFSLRVYLRAAQREGPTDSWSLAANEKLNWSRKMEARGLLRILAGVNQVGSAYRQR
jgi:hypothetical protein